jgi:hypothetical protein
VQHVDLPQGTMAQPEIERLREWIDHPWIADRRDEVLAGVARLERAVERAARPRRYQPSSATGISVGPT